MDNQNKECKLEECYDGPKERLCWSKDKDWFRPTGRKHIHIQDWHGCRDDSCYQGEHIENEGALILWLPPIDQSAEGAENERSNETGDSTDANLA